MENKFTHFLYTPFTGLGLYSGYRGSRWLKSRILIFKQFVVPSLLAQTNQDFILWVSWRHEERNNSLVIELNHWLLGTGLKFVFTFSGVVFFDDKYPDDIARERLINAIHGSMGELLNVMGEAKEIYMTIQPSDDCYHKNAVQALQELFNKMPDIQAFGFSKGYICNYRTKEIREYIPTTNPPFYTIKFSRETFIDPFKHCEYTSIKKDIGKYKAGTPIPSHEYVEHALKYGKIDERGFLVGCHGENVSTHFNNPFGGEKVTPEVLKDFGLYDVEPIKIKFSIRKRLLRMLPYKAQRKIRYWFGELVWQKLYNWLRS